MDATGKRVYCDCCDDYVSRATRKRHKDEGERKKRMSQACETKKVTEKVIFDAGLSRVAI